jgi:hypothetical protein
MVISQRGFGFVTIGANVDDFHRAATESATRIGLTIAERDKTFQGQRQPACAMPSSTTWPRPPARSPCPRC